MSPELTKKPDTRPEPIRVQTGHKPIGYFVHHQGRGHAKRCAAIVELLAPRPVAVFCADPGLLPLMGEHVTVIPIADFHAQPAATSALHEIAAADGLDCAPVGVQAITDSMTRLARWFDEAKPALLVVDVSSEVTLLARLCSIPTVTLRMHGDRQDQAHTTAYSGSAGILAPFDERLEQRDWPDEFRRKTFYTGGLIDSRTTFPSRAEARRVLGLPPDRQIVVAMSGGGTGIPYAPLTLAARALPDTLWLSVGRSLKYGHETDFANLRDCGWVDSATDYLSAADIVLINPGDTLVHEVAHLGRPLVCLPEWCYYDEQHCKARELARVGAAIYAPSWPASFEQWRALIGQVQSVDVDLQRSLVNHDASRDAARWIEQLAARLWGDGDRPREDETGPVKATCRLRGDAA